MSAWMLHHFWSPIQAQCARLWHKASWGWERQHFCHCWGLRCLFGKTAATSMEQGLSSERGSLETWACTALFSSCLGPKICPHNLGGDPSHVGISWPIVMGAQISVAGFLCAAVGNYLQCSHLWQWRCPLLSPKCWRSLSWWMLFNKWFAHKGHLGSDMVWGRVGFTEASDPDEKSYMVKWVSLTDSCSGLFRNH